MAGSVSATTAIAAGGLALSAVGTGVSVMGAMQNAAAAKASADYQAKVAQGNEAIAAQNATYTAAEGEANAAIQDQKTRAAIGTEIAAEGSSGVDVNGASSSALRTSTAELGQLDANTIRSNAARQAYGYEVQASGFQNNASADTATGQNAQTAGNISGAAGLLSGAGNASLNYANVMNKGSGLGDTPSGVIGAAAGDIFDNPQAY